VQGRRAEENSHKVCQKISLFLEFTKGGVSGSVRMSPLHRHSMVVKRFNPMALREEVEDPYLTKLITDREICAQTRERGGTVHLLFVDRREGR